MEPNFWGTRERKKEEKADTESTVSQAKALVVGQPIMDE